MAGVRPFPSFLFKGRREPDPRTCTECGREGTRGFTLNRPRESRYGSDRYVCTSEDACKRRKAKDARRDRST